MRSGNKLSTYISEDGINFVQVSELEYETLPDTLLVGVMASNRNATGYNKAIFNDITLIKG